MVEISLSLGVSTVKTNRDWGSRFLNLSRSTFETCRDYPSLRQVFETVEIFSSVKTNILTVLGSRVSMETTSRQIETPRLRFHVNFFKGWTDTKIRKYITLHAMAFSIDQHQYNTIIDAQVLEIQGGFHFFGKFFWGGYLGLWENQGCRVLLHFYVEVFQKSL
jgi:hypothetical protein